MKLVGASWAFIRRPFLRRNFWIGVLAAFIADSILWGAAVLAGVLRTGVGQGDYARGDGAGVGCRAGVRCTYYVAVRFAFHQQISEDEGKHAVLYLTP